MNRGLQVAKLVLANTLWLGLCLPSWLWLRWSVGCVARVQERQLLALVKSNRHTAFGRAHGFDRIRSISDFQERVPLSSYADYSDAVEQIGRGASRVLTADPVLFFQPSSGSTAATKLLPFTGALRGQYRRAIRAWIFDLLCHRPRLLTGESYWSITPSQGLAGGFPAAGKVRVNFDDEANYLSLADKLALLAAWTVPPDVGAIKDGRTFRYVTLLFLLRTDNLRLISVWSPTFLLLLLEHVSDDALLIARDLEAGTITPANPDDEEALAGLRRRLRPDAVRAAALRRIWNRPDATLAEQLAETWPRLTLISAWGAAGASGPLERVRQLFPRVEIQPKGLIATEAFVSFPWTSACNASMLAFRSHFYEFETCGEEQGTRLAHQLIPGENYSVVVTTAGGLYRYRLRDEVQVAGYYGQAPLLRFVGKADQVVDLAGEKLNAAHVTKVLEALQRRSGIAPDFQLLAPEVTSPASRYTLFLGFAGAAPRLTNLGAQLDELLSENFHYRYCRRLGQLDAPGIFVVDQSRCVAHVVYLERLGRERRLGNIKPTPLDHRDDWAEWFPGRYVDQEPAGAV